MKDPVVASEDRHNREIESQERMAFMEEVGAENCPNFPDECRSCRRRKNCK